MSTLTILTAFPGANVPSPDGHQELKVPPGEMRSGDRLLLAGQIRTVQRRVESRDSGVIVLLYAADDSGQPETWVPETGDLPIPIWRPDRRAPRATSAMTAGRPDATSGAVAASLADVPGLGPRLVRGLDSVPATADDRGAFGDERAHWPAFERTRPIAPQAPTPAHNSNIANLFSAMAIVRTSAHQSDQF